MRGALDVTMERSLTVQNRISRPQRKSHSFLQAPTGQVKLEKFLRPAPDERDGRITESRDA